MGQPLTPEDASQGTANISIEPDQSMVYPKVKGGVAVVTPEWGRGALYKMLRNVGLSSR